MYVFILRIPRRDIANTFLTVRSWLFTTFKALCSFQKHTVSILTVLLLTSILSCSIAQETPGVCPQFVNNAMTELGSLCADMPRSSACYGHYRLSASFKEDVSSSEFDEPSDQIELASLASITTAAFDAESEEWGIAVLSVQANVPNSLPGQAVKFILMGDAQLINAVPEEDSLTPVDPIQITTADQANLRSSPSLDANIEAIVEANTVLEADGISTDGAWLRVFHERTNLWISQNVVEPVALGGLPIIDEETFTPMQAFYFTTGIGQPLCNEAPDMLMVQGPDEVIVDLNINGAQVAIGSTAIFRGGTGSINEILSNSEIPDHIRTELEQPDVNQEDLCGLVQIMVVSGEVELNRGTLILPEGHTALSVACDFEDGDENVIQNTQDPEAPTTPPVFMTDWVQPDVMTDDNLEDIAPLENIPEDVINYPVRSPKKNQFSKLQPIIDTDADGIPDINDNCPTVPNTLQSIPNRGDLRNVCNPDKSHDKDSDGVPDAEDNCPFVENPHQADQDGDGVGNLCDPDFRPDRDRDGIVNSVDNCPRVSNPNQQDQDKDGIGNVCDPDRDGDGINNGQDNCPRRYNPPQNDLDGDGLGNICDPDRDGDGINNGQDNCPMDANPDQNDSDGNGVGDACSSDDDSDGDGILNEQDNCPDISNPPQNDLDDDGIGNICDDDKDGDGILNEQDNCPDISNPPQNDLDGDGIGNICDNDKDGDDIDNDQDNCPMVNNPPQNDLDGDGIGNICDKDRDGDDIDNDQDNCPMVSNPPQNDLDGDGIGNICDNDKDGDGINNGQDNCPGANNPQQKDLDGDGLGNMCDGDADGDGINNGQDNCPMVSNPPQNDMDGDGIGNICDGDADGDGINNGQDNCPGAYNPPQNDMDGDGIGNICDGDADGDGINNGQDNCPGTYNPPQNDMDGDGLGNICDGDKDGDGVDNGADACPADPNCQ